MTSTTPLQQRLAARYRIERLLGRGGMGAVYLARDLQLDRLVAVKELPDEFARDEILRERFLREVRVAASFSHPNIVPVYAVEEQDESLAFVMGYVEGESLAERVRRAGPLSTRETARLMLDVAYALAYAHGRGVVHRDIKPDNIMIERATGRALLMDFGVARSIQTTPSAGAGMTRVGEAVGTPEYMSPEQATGESIDGRSDLYSLGLTAYFALTGVVAFGDDSAARVLVRQLTETLPSVATVRTDLTRAFARVIDRCLAKEAADRFADAGALIEALDAAHAAAPEVPAVIRLFAQEAETLGMVIGYLALFALFLLTSPSLSVGIFDRTIPVVVIVAVAVGRVAQTRAEASRLLAQGFTVDAVRSGFRQTMDEREERRTQLRTDPTIVTRRRRTVFAGVFMLVSAVVLIAMALASREFLPNGTFVPLYAVVMLYSGLCCLGFGLVLLMRSPLRMSLWERVFRAVWFGGIGTMFLRSSAKGVVRAAETVRGVAAVENAPRGERATVATASSPIDKRVDSLEARVTQLERERRTPQP